MKNLILATSALALTAGMALADGHAKTIRLGTEGAYPPYNFLDDNGEVAGFERFNQLPLGAPHDRYWLALRMPVVVRVVPEQRVIDLKSDFAETIQKRSEIAAVGFVQRGAGQCQDCRKQVAGNGR